MSFISRKTVSDPGIATSSLFKKSDRSQNQNENDLDHTTHQVSLNWDSVQTALHSKKAKTFFGQEVLSVISHHVNYRMRKFQFGNLTVKISGSEIYVKSPIAENKVFKIQKLFVKNLTTYEAARKRVKNKHNKSERKILKKEFNTLILIKTLATIEEKRPELKWAFQETPYNFIRTKKSYYYEGPIYKGDLYDLVFDSNRDLSASQILFAYDSMISGVSFLQENNIIHVDIKLENIFYEELVDDNYFFRLADFGSVVNYHERSQLGEVLTFTYTKDYTPAFEVPYLKNSEDQLHALSSFLLGEVLFRTFVKKLPFKNYIGNALLNMSNSRLELIDTVKIPEAAAQFIKTLLAKNPIDRPTGSDLYNAWQKAKKEMPEINFRP